MTEVITTMPVDTIDRTDNETTITTTATENPSSPPQSPSPPPPRHRNSRERRNDDERPPNRRSDYYDHRNNNRSPPNGPPVHHRVEYKRRGGSSISPPPYRRGGGGGYDRRSPPYQKRFRRDDGGYDNRRGSPRGPADRRVLDDIYHTLKAGSFVYVHILLLLFSYCSVAQCPLSVLQRIDFYVTVGCGLRSTAQSSLRRPIRLVSGVWKFATGRYNNKCGAHMVPTLARVNLKLEWSGRALLVAFELFCNSLLQYVNPTYKDKVVSYLLSLLAACFVQDPLFGSHNAVIVFAQEKLYTCSCGSLYIKSSCYLSVGAVSLEVDQICFSALPTPHIALLFKTDMHLLHTYCNTPSENGPNVTLMASKQTQAEDFIHKNGSTKLLNKTKELIDWDSGRGGYNGHANTSREGLMSYKQFIQELEDDVLPSEAERRYQEYKSEYISTQKRAYFDAHKGEDWLKDKYHPTNLLSVIERRNEVARKLAKEFLLDLEDDSLDLGPGVTASSSYKSGQTSTPNSEDESDLVGKKRRHGKISSNQFLSAPKAHPVSSEHRRIQTDVLQAQALVKKLDLEKGIDDNMLSRADNDRSHREKSHSSSSGPVVIIRGSNAVKGLEGVELLDTLITYLWRIHGVDYYGMTEKSEAKGVRHVRAESKSSDAKTSGVEWEDKLDSHWQDRLKGLDPLEIMTAKEKIDAAAAESLDPYVRKIQDEKYGWKYGCGAKGCTKLFHAAEFVHKHLKLKHPELSMEVTSKVREDLYFQNYMNDEDAPGGKPIMQQSLPKERPQRQRPGIGDRLKDDRDFRRDRNNGGDRFDKGENPDSSEFQSNNDDGGHDDQMFDSFSGQGVHAQFPSDVPPPPVLMPVPGAGPLGPFIPAPPEVAMRMMRDQGGPSPFEGAGRNVLARLQMTAPAPMIALPPSFRQDPRRLRRQVLV
ncbi:serrate RNA effector molecule [Tanacetum coccineum]